MRAVLALLLLSACAMTPERACLAARVVVAGMEASVPEGYTLDSAREDAKAVCDVPTRP